MKKITVKELLILFQEWQMETKAPNYNFAHNGVAGNFMAQNAMENTLIINNHINVANVHLLRTPKQAAKELIEKYLLFCNHDFAKQCALITAHEILNTRTLDPYGNIDAVQFFWLEVIREI